MKASGRSRVLPAVLAYLAFLPAVGLLPYLVRPAASVVSAGTASGYNNRLAYQLAMVVALGIIGLFALREPHRVESEAVEERGGLAAPRTMATGWVEPAIVFALFVLLYYPVFLARYGPYNEDNYFLTVLHRMNAGLRPYRDFEFPYGPLMVYMAHGWMTVFGYSMRSYYALLCLLEATQFSLLIVLLRRWVPDTRKRLVVFAFFGVFLFDTLLGLNWNGVRRLLPAAALLCAASVPYSRARSLAAAALCGISIAYSPDVGIPCLIAVVASYLFGFLRTREWQWLRRACAVGAAAVGFWIALLALVLRGTLPDYLRSAWYVMRRFSLGEAGFAFYWTVNSLAVFALLTLCCITVGRGLGKRLRVPLTSGDLLFFAAVCFALLGLRSGLNRADMWHLNAPLLPLFFALTAPWPRSVFQFGPMVRRIAFPVLAIICLSYIPGILPSGAFYIAGWRGGLIDSLQGRPAHVAGAVSRAPITEVERSHPDVSMLALAADLASQSHRDQPVIFYSEAWLADTRAGVYKSGFATDDVLLDDAAGEQIRHVLDDPRGALAVLTREESLNIYEGEPAALSKALPFYSRTPTKVLASFTSSVHFEAMEAERRVRQARWYRTVGYYLKAHFVPVGQYGEYVLLGRANQQ